MPLVNDTLFIWPLFFAAVFLDLVIGEYPSVLHPVVWMGNLIRRGIGIADRASSRPGRFFGGASVVLFGGLLFGVVTVAVTLWYTSAYKSVIAVLVPGLICVFMLKGSFSLSALLKASASVRAALDDGNIQEARRLTAENLVSRDMTELNSNEVSAAVIESISENFTDSVAAPWFYLFIAGPAAAVVYRFVNTCDSMTGYRTEKYEWLGKFAARFDDVLNFIPARIAAFFLVISAVFQKGMSGRRSFWIMLHEHRVTESPNAGWTMSAAAGALGVKLVKRGHYTIDGGAGLPVPGDIKRAEKLVGTAITVNIVFAVVFWFLVSGVFF